jgi:trehalose-6-phosphatase
MPHSKSASDSGNIEIVIHQSERGFVCEATPTMDGRIGPTQRYHGQNPKHAIAIALENLASKFRTEAETVQKIDWEAVDRLPSGNVIEKRFHVILHYERVTEEESKFEAMHNTLIGNTVVENAEITVIQVDPGLSIKPLKK